MARKSKQRKSGRAKRAKDAKVGKATARTRRAESNVKMTTWLAMPRSEWSEARKARNPEAAVEIGSEDVVEKSDEASGEGAAL